MSGESSLGSRPQQPIAAVRGASADAAPQRPEHAPSLGAPSLSRDLEGDPPANRPPVCGVLVTFNPDLENFAKVLAAALPQIDRLVLVDNASDPVLRANIRTLLDRLAPPNSDHAKVTLIQNESNVGLARALNRGIRSAPSQGHQCFLILDHDSILEEGAVARLTRELKELQGRFRVGALGAANVELGAPGLGTDTFLGGSFRRRPFLVREHVQDVKLLMGSGLFVDSTVFDAAGLFDESYFVDAFDFEFSLRLRSQGYHLFLIESSRISHTRAQFENVRIGKWAFGFHKPSVGRQYFVSRDYVRTANKYLRTEPGMSLFIYLVLLVEVFRTVLFYGDSTSRLARLAEGVVDGLRA
jgi:rhamnosyltransferase